MNDNFLYVMSDGINYKIGVSKNPVERALGIRTQSKKKISILLSINCKDAYGCEAYLHNRYKDSNIQGEWFSFKDRSFLKDVWDVCINNLVDNNMFICVDSKLNQKDPVLDSFVETNVALSYNVLYKYFNGKYSQTALPAMLVSLGCLKISRKEGSFYITPKGLSELVDRQHYSDIEKVANVLT